MKIYVKYGKNMVFFIVSYGKYVLKTQWWKVTNYICSGAAIKSHF